MSYSQFRLKILNEIIINFNEIKFFSTQIKICWTQRWSRDRNEGGGANDACR